MKNIMIVIFIILAILFFTTSKEERGGNDLQSVETPTKTFVDTPANNYEQRVETLNIANTLQAPVNNYLDSRVNARVDAQNALKQGNEQIESRNDAMEALTK